MKLIIVLCFSFLVLPKIFAQTVMNEEKVWQLIDSVNSVNSLLKNQKKDLLLEKLSRFSDEDLVIFDFIIYDLHQKADTWDLSAVDKIFSDNSMMEEDDHYYFNYALISLGKKNFYAILEDADKIFDYIPINVPSKENTYSFEYQDFVYGGGHQTLETRYKGQYELMNKVFDTINASLFNKLKIENAHKTPQFPPFGHKAKSLKELEKRLPKIWKRFAPYRCYEEVFDWWVNGD
jgi:hypothetical protein